MVEFALQFSRAVPTKWTTCHTDIGYKTGIAKGVPGNPSQSGECFEFRQPIGRIKKMDSKLGYTAKLWADSLVGE